jgi:hypothetical protein
MVGFFRSVFGPVIELELILGALAPEATRLQGLKARPKLGPVAAGLKLGPSVSHKYSYL